MSAKRKAPLEVVRVVRSRNVDAASEKTQQAIVRTHKARERFEQAQNYERATREALLERQKSEREALEQGSSIYDFRQLDAFKIQVENQLHEVAAQTTLAHEEFQNAQDLENKKRSELIAARSELDAVEQYQKKWRAKQMQVEQEKIDETAEEIAAARRLIRG